MAGVINRIRSKAGLMIGVIGLAMFAFVAQDLLSSLTGLFGTGRLDPDHMATVHGHKLSSEYFKSRVGFEEQLQLLVSGQEPDPSQREQRETSAWNQLMRDIVIAKELEELGYFDVDSDRWRKPSDYNMLIAKLTQRQFDEAFFGQNPLQQITNFFQTGARFKEMIDQPNPDNNQELAEYKNRLLAYQYVLEREHIQSSYLSLLKAGTLVSMAQAKQDFLQQNTKFEVDYLAVNYAALADSLYEPTESELKRFYEDNRERYRQDKDEAVVQMVIFDHEATQRDTTSARKYLEDLKETFRTTPNDSLFAVSRNRSETVPPITGWQNSATLTPDLLALVEGQPNGSILGPVQVDATFRMVKLIDREQRNEKPYVKVRQILVTPKGATEQDSLEALNRANALRAEASPQTFDMLVFDQRNDDPQKMQNRGEMGWYPYGAMGEEFDKALASAFTGQIIGPLRSEQGYHILEVQERNTNAIRVATVSIDVEAGSSTLDSLKRLADNLIGLHMRENKPLEELSKEHGYRMVTSQPLASGASFIQGGIRGQAIKEILTWGLDKAQEVGEVRENVVVADNAYIVLSLKDRFEKGYKTLDQVRDQVKTRVMAEKKGAAIVEKLNNVPADTNLTKMANAYGPGAFASSAKDLNFASQGIQGMQDPILIGKLMGMQQGQTSAPIVGRAGVYIVRVTNHKAADATEEALKAHRTTVQNRERNSFPERAVQGLIQAAEVVDYRYRF